MLRELYIENLAVIAQAGIPFSGRFNVFTGETGAGKSILIHGINAVLGQRVTKDIVRTGCEKAVITALFTDLPETVKAILTEMGIQEQEELLLTREIFADGGSTARINHKTATVSALRSLGSQLIDIHGQHDTRLLMEPEQHMQMIDRFGGAETLLNAYQESFRTLQKKAKRLSELVKSAKEQEQKRAYLTTLVEDVTRAALEAGEEDAVNLALERMEQSEQIAAALRGICQMLEDERSGIVSRLRDAQDTLERQQALVPEAAALCSRLEASSLELSDISDTVEQLAGQVELDEMQYAQLKSRSAEIRELTKSYVCTGDVLVQRCEEAKQALSQMQSNAAEIEQLRQEKTVLLAEVSERAKALSVFRAEAAERFTERVAEQLQFLDMPGVRLSVQHDTGKLTLQGMDRMELMISANRGEDVKPLAKIASGGELSRIMLALKCVSAELESIPTMIFDEIDTGVSGRAAQKIGSKLYELGQVRQVLCITHLVQIGVMANHHLMIEKKTVDGRTATSVTPLNLDGRVKELARIMGGESPDPLILESARAQLLEKHPELAEQNK